MHGFNIVIHKPDLETEVKFSWKDKLLFQEDLLHKNFSGKRFKAEILTKCKFGANKINFANNNLLVLSEGIILNLTELKIKYKAKDDESFFSTVLENNSIINEFKGNYCGIILNKISGEYIAFNNHTATKKLFYYHSTDITVIATDLYSLNFTVTNLGIKTTPDIQGAYFLLTSGFMHDNYTLISEIKQVRAGEYLKCDETGHWQINTYFSLNTIQFNTLSKEDILHELDYLYNKAIGYEFEIDTENNFMPLVTLSGGLDSRLTSLQAYNLGFVEQQIINFSEKEYADHVIAAHIANEYKFPFKYISLSSDTLSLFKESVSINDGLTTFVSSSLLLDVIPVISSIENSGILHTGILGDAIFGSYIKHIQNNKAAITEGNYSNFLTNKVATQIQTSIDKYEYEEYYKFYNRGFNGINNGYIFYDLVTETCSPFMEPDFFRFVLSIPRELRFKERIYIEWLQKHHPAVCNYVWENSGGKPTNSEIKKQFYRYKRALLKRLPVKSMWKGNMSPEQTWYEKNKFVRDKLDDYFANTIEKVDFSKELQTDLIQLFNQKGIHEKSNAITYLAALELLFNK